MQKLSRLEIIVLNHFKKLIEEKKLQKISKHIQKVKDNKQTKTENKTSKIKKTTKTKNKQTTNIINKTNIIDYNSKTLGDYKKETSNKYTPLTQEFLYQIQKQNAYSIIVPQIYQEKEIQNYKKNKSKTKAQEQNNQIYTNKQNKNLVGSDINFSKEKIKKTVEHCGTEYNKHQNKALKVMRARKNNNITVKTNKNFQDFTRNNNIQQGFGLAETITQDTASNQEYTINAFNTKTGKYENTTINSNTVYATIDKNSTNHLEWKISNFIDTDTGKETSSLYLEDITEFKEEAKKQFGDYDNNGTRVNGLLILIDGKEPGEGTTPLADFKLKPGQKIDLVYKKDGARYEELKEAA